MKRLFLLLTVLPQCTGCLYYAYPTIATTPELVVRNDDGSAHAFRIEIDRTERKPMPTRTEYSLMRIPMDGRGIVPSQLEVAPTTGVLNPFGLGDTKDHEKNSFTMVVRFYRPGFKTMEVRAWEKSRTLDWSPAPDFLAQEKAVDDLLAVPEQSSRATWWELKDEKTPGLGLLPGATSPSHRAALAFAASEYERLSNSPMANSVNMQPLRDRLRAKATWLRSFAEQAPVR